MKGFDLSPTCLLLERKIAAFINAGSLAGTAVVPMGVGWIVLSYLRRAFQLYSAETLSIVLPGFDLIDARGEKFGVVDRYGWDGRRLFIEGWTLGAQVQLSTDQEHISAVPSLLRTDVKNEVGLSSAAVGFVMNATTFAGHANLCVERDDLHYMFALPRPPALVRRKAQIGLIGPFAFGLIRSAPLVLRWLRTGDPSMRIEVRRRLGILARRNDATRPARAVFAEGSGNALFDPAPSDTPITIILPVYNAADMLDEVLDRVERHTDLPYHLVVVEDASSDPSVRPMLRERMSRAGSERMTLLENDENLGFIRSVNRGFGVALERGDHVVLLNSDAFVPPNWASRLIGPLTRDPTVATVTPMSNDAEIFSVPHICRATTLAPGEADAIDATAAQLAPGAGSAEAPTAVGFCMAMNAQYLAKFPLFDTTFGRGYGEEVDWCQKVRVAGGRHIGLPSLFVEHRGGASFGTADKLKLVAENNKEISRRYPKYDAEVQEFAELDPMAAPRFVLAVALAAEQQTLPVSIYLSHSLGGGAESYLQHRIATEVETVVAAVVLRVGGSSRWIVELHQAHGVISVATDSLDVVDEMLRPLHARHVVYSCGVGDRDPVALPDCLLRISGAGDRSSIEILFHDFFPISPSYCLLDDRGWFTGVPSRNSQEEAHATIGSDGQRVTHDEWRESWGRLMEASEVVRVFSQDSKRHVATAYPSCADRIEVLPHKLWKTPPRITPPHESGRVIGVLGGINYPKGAQAISDLSRVLGQHGATRLVLIGQLDPAFTLDPHAVVHGRYKVEEIGSLATRYGVTDWLIPSIWPETFSFSTHEALATGLPVWCFDLGAQAEAVRSAANGLIIPLPSTPTEVCATLLDYMFDHPSSVRTKKQGFFRA